MATSAGPAAEMPDLTKTASAPASTSSPATATTSSSSTATASGATALSRLTASPKPQGSNTASARPSPRPPQPGSLHSGGGTSAKAATDPILRNALRYTISAREYAALHRYVLAKSRVLRRAAPSVASVERMLEGKGDSSGLRRASAAGGGGGGRGGKTRREVESRGRDDYNARTVRHALRVFAATAVGVKGWDVIKTRILGERADSQKKSKQPQHRSGALRLSLSLSTILLLYRLLFRFLTRLRARLLDASAAPFRRRNPRASAALTSRYAPAVGASLAGLALGVFPARQLRVTIAIFVMFRALEFAWNAGEDLGMIWGWREGARGTKVMRERPWWWGSWMLQPLAFGQLLHAVVFDRDCFPTAYGDFIFKSSSAYIHPRPEDYPAHIRWPSAYEIVDNLATMAKLNWPPYVSPSLFPNKETLPASLAAVAPLTSTAHPLITSLSCAALHPSDPSCLRTYLTFWLRSFPPLGRFFLLVYSAMLVPRLGRLYDAPVATLKRLLGQALSMTGFVTGSISTAWASICFFQQWFPRSFLATQRFFLGGFLAGLWGWMQRRSGRSVFLYSARASVDSLWKVGVKRRWWRGMRGGDVWIFVLAMALTGVVYEREARAVREEGWRRGISWVRGEGWRDWSFEEEGDDDDDEEEEEEEEEREE